MLFTFVQKRCKAITLKGSRCKSIRKNNSDYCFSHRKYIPKRFDIFKRYRIQISFSTVLAIIFFAYQFFTSPTREEVVEEHRKTRDEIINIEKSFDELKSLVERLLKLPEANKGIIKENIDSYVSKSLSDYKRMESLINVDSEKLKSIFPKGFALFSSDEAGVILPLNEKPLIENLEIDWSKTKVEKLTNTEFSVRLPDFIDTKFSGTFKGIYIGGQRIKNRAYGGFKIGKIEPVVMIIEDYGTQIVFVISLT